MEDPSAAPPLQGCQELEQFLLLAKTAKGPAVVELIKQVWRLSDQAWNQLVGLGGVPPLSGTRAPVNRAVECAGFSQSQQDAGKFPYSDVAMVVQ